MIDPLSDGMVADRALLDAAVVDAGRFDAGPIEMITVTGVIEGEDTGTGAPLIEGARVAILFPNGFELAFTTTAADGSYTVTSAAGMLMLLRVGPVADYLGVVRGEVASPSDYEAYGLRLARRDRVEAAVTMSGSVFDPALGYLVAGYNPVSVDAGGEGATLDTVTHDPAFVLYPGGLTVTNVLPRICVGGETPIADGCALTGRNNQITFPNIAGTPATLGIIQPTGGTCVERFGIPSWPVFPDTLIAVNVDCTPS